MNDMRNCRNLFHFTLYADDTTILSTLQLFETPESSGIINDETYKINQCLQANELTNKICGFQNKTHEKDISPTSSLDKWKRNRTGVRI